MREMRGGLWIRIGAIAVGLAAVLVVVALIGNSDNSGETVSAPEWADGVCASVGVWRGEMEAIVEDIRTPPAVGSSTEEPQSETPQGRTGFIREGLTRAVRATQVLVVSVDNTGTPDTPNGEEAASLITTWVGDALGDLERAETALVTESDTLEGSVEQLTQAGGAIASTLTSGAKTLADVAEVDPEISAALKSSPKCQLLREEQSGS